MKEIVKVHVGYNSPAEEWLSSLSEDIIKANQPVSKLQKEKFFILQSNPDFLLRMAKIRTQFGILTKIYKDRLEWAKNLYKTKKINKTKSDFDREIEKLLYSFRISKRWQKAIEYYVIFNRSPQNLIPPAIDFWVNSDFHSIVIKINRNTTLDDIKENWKEIEKNKSALEILSEEYKTNNGRRILKFRKPKRYTPIKEFQKYKKAFRLRQSGLTYMQIAKEMGFGKIHYSDVGIFINRFKRIIRENELY